MPAPHRAHELPVPVAPLGLVLDAMPGSDAGDFARREAVSSRRREALAKLDERFQSDENAACWPTGRTSIHDVVAPEQRVPGRMVGEIAEAEGRCAWDVLTSIARATSSSTPLRHRPRLTPTTTGRIHVWRDRRFSSSGVRTRPPGPPGVVQLRHRGGARCGGSQLLPGGGEPSSPTSPPVLRRQGAGPGGGGLEGRRRRPRSRDHRSQRACADPPGGAGLYAEADGIEHVAERHRHRPQGKSPSPSQLPPGARHRPVTQIAPPRASGRRRRMRGSTDGCS